MVFQDYHNALLPWRTVARNVAIGLEHRTASAGAPSRRRPRLAERGTARPGQRVPLAPVRWDGAARAARAGTRHGRRVLLMDEPFGALDAITKAGLQDVLLDLHARAGSTIVFVTHDLDEALYLSDRVLVITGTPGTIATSLPTNLPWPRDQLATRALPGYIEARNLLGQALGADGDG